MPIKFKYLIYSLPVLLIIFLIILVKAQELVSCTTTPATLGASDVNGSTVNISWKNGQNYKVTYLNISTSSSLNPDRSFSDTADIVNDVVTDKNSYSKSSLKPGTYYWNIVSDGCGQRKVSDLSSFTIQSAVNSDCKFTPAVLGTPVVKGSKVTLSWTNNQNVGATYINVSTSNNVNTDGILQKSDIANDVVSGNFSYSKEILSPGTYYWNIVSDGCGQRKVSDLSSFTIQSE